MPAARILRSAQIAVAAACLIVPLTMFLAGERGDPVDNRSVAQRPALGVGSVFDTTTTRAFTRYLDDAFPFRDEAVRASARVDGWFGDSSNADVVIGTGGFLFLRNVTEQPCIDDDRAALVDAVLRRAERIVESAGRSITFVIAPNKAAIHNGEARSPVCPLVTAESLGNGLLDGRLVTFWDEMRAETAAGVKTYRRLDTHWTPLGAAVGAEAIVDVLAPGRWDDSFLQPNGTTSRPGDLTVLLGLPQNEEIPRLRSDIADRLVTMQTQTFVDRNDAEIEGALVTTYTSEWPEAIGGETLFLSDSYGLALVPLLGLYFDDLASTRQSNEPHLGYLRDRIIESERIIWLGSARGIDTTVLGAGLDAQFAVAFSDELSPVSVVVECSGPCTVQLDDQVVDPATSDIYVVASLPEGAEPALISAQGRTIRLDDTNTDGGWLLGEDGLLTVDGAFEGIRFRAVAVPRVG